MWAFNGEMGKPGTGGTLVQMQGVPSGGNSVLVYFSAGVALGPLDFGRLGCIMCTAITPVEV